MLLLCRNITGNSKETSIVQLPDSREKICQQCVGLGRGSSLSLTLKMSWRIEQVGQRLSGLKVGEPICVLTSHYCFVTVLCVLFLIVCRQVQQLRFLGEPLRQDLQILRCSGQVCQRAEHRG